MSLTLVSYCQSSMVVALVILSKAQYSCPIIRLITQAKVT